MTTNISLRIPIDLIVSADKKLAKRGQKVRSINELIRVVMLDFVSTEPDIDEFGAYKHYEFRFKKVKQTANVDLVRQMAKEVHIENKEK